MTARKYTTAEIAAMIVADNLAPFYNSRAWRRLSHDVILKNNNECYLCRKAGKVIPAEITHHVNELKQRPDLAYSREYIDKEGKVQKNLLPLCWHCHEKIHHRGLYAEPSKQKFSTPERW